MAAAHRDLNVLAVGKTKDVMVALLSDKNATRGDEVVTDELAGLHSLNPHRTQREEFSYR
jgi:hypothetical protein